MESNNNTKKNSSKDPRPNIGIIGVGGAGGNAVNNMIQAKLSGVHFLAANTDAQALATTLAPEILQLGVNLTSGLGSGANVDIGRGAAKETEEKIRAWVSEFELIFITAGMGGGTGTGAAPVIADIARSENTLTVGVITLPFDFEGSQRMRVAKEGLLILEKLVDTLVVIPNQNLFAISDVNTTLSDAFLSADEVLRDAIRSITDLIVLPGLINLDFADVKAVITKPGRAMLGSGEAKGENRAIDAAEAAIANPLIETFSIKGAEGLLINVTGGSDMTLFEIDEAANRVRAEVGGDQLVIFGSAFDQKLEGSIRVSVVATGLNETTKQDSLRPELNLSTEPVDETNEKKLILEENKKKFPLPIKPIVEDEISEENRLKEIDEKVDNNIPIPSPSLPWPIGPHKNETTHSLLGTKIPETRNTEKRENKVKTAKKSKKTIKKSKSSWAEKLFRLD